MWVTCTSISYLFCSCFRLLLVGVACVSTRIGKGQTGTVSAQGVCALRGSQISIRPASLKYVVCLLYDDKYFSVACRPEMTYTVLSRASTHGHSQLKHQKTRVGSCTEEVVEWFNYPRASAHHRCEVSCQGVSTCIIALSVLRQGQPNGEESCIVPESGSNCSLVAKVLQHSSLAVPKFCAASEKHCEQGYRQVCANL